MERAPLLFVISAPSGSGKTTLCDRLVAQVPDLVQTVSMTTRAPRQGERNGADYIFVSAEEFEKLRAQDAFVEYAPVFGHLYGTPLNQIEDIFSRGKDALLNIDVQGARQIKRRFPKSVLIFVKPPSTKELERRLRGRSTETDSEIAKRLAIAAAEMERAVDYDYVVVNDTLEAALEELGAVIAAERCKTL
ncbi:MAG: guanylate kinase [Candidatus Omnitrophica bacterium]|nr:guanylate kinase [Candidatus Omnitrophota bacterium]